MRCELQCPNLNKNAHAACKNMMGYRKLDCEVLYKIDMNKPLFEEGSMEVLISNPYYK